MRPTTFTFPAPDYNGIAATQNITTSTGAYIVLNGDLTNYPSELDSSGSVRATFPGIQRTIGVFSTGNLSAVVFQASGLDLRGAVITASFVGPSGGSSAATDAFATFTVEFNVINVLFTTAAATSVFTVGTGATGATNWVQTDTFITPFSVQGTVVTGTVASATPQSTAGNPNTSSAPAVFNHPTGALTANTQFTYTSPVPWTRYIVTTNSATGVGSTLIYQQAGNGS
jgi:hypothetical protein